LQYLGPAAEYIDLVCDQSEASLQIIPGAAHHSIHANWKLLAENGVDAYHLPHAHKRFLDFLNVLGADPTSHKRTGVGLALGQGHAVIKSGPPSTGRPIAYWSALFPESMKPIIERRYAGLIAKFGAERAHDIALTNRSLYVFPNLVINDILGLNIRTFFPSGPTRVDVSVWGAGFADETEEERAMRIDGLISFIGPGGLGTPDDVEILESCQRAYAHGGTCYSDFSRGLAHGTSHHTDEAQNRGFWIEWSNRMKVAVA
jgi:benzoate/toluate 1,2-dioxygenase alpha subunit